MLYTVIGTFENRLKEDEPELGSCAALPGLHRRAQAALESVDSPSEHQGVRGPLRGSFPLWNVLNQDSYRLCTHGLSSLSLSFLISGLITPIPVAEPSKAHCNNTPGTILPSTVAITT